MAEISVTKKFGSRLPKLNTAIPGIRSQRLSRQSLEFEPEAITRISSDNPRIFWERTKGANVLDVDGNIYIDCTSAFGVSFIGHNDTAIDKSIIHQTRNFIHGMGDIFPSEARIKLSHKILEVLSRKGDSQVLFANSGSECVEIAIKASLLYTQKPGIISFKGAFHGQTLGTLNLIGYEELKGPFFEYLSKHTRLMPFHNPYREGSDFSDYPLLDECLEKIETEIQKSIDTPSPIGTIIVEPIQGCNGYIIPSDLFLINLSLLCKKYSLLFIADEIFAGLGRTGRWLSVNHVGLDPDIICIGKILGGGMPIAACVAHKQIFRAFNSSSFLPLHGSTFGGDPILCSSAISVIEKIQNYNYLEEATRKGAILMRKLMQLKEKYELIGDIRGRGLLIAVELVKDRYKKEPASYETSYIVESALKKGVIFITTRIPFGNVIGIAPPVVITEEQMNFAVEVLDSCLGEICKQKDDRDKYVL